MGSLGPYAFPNPRKCFEASYLGTSRGAQGFALAAAFVFGTPSLLVPAGGIVEARGELAGAPSLVALAGGAVEARGELRGAPQVSLGPTGGTLAGSSSLSAQTVAVRPTLLDKLGPKIGGLRATLALKIGDRPYRVYLTTVRWSGGEPGRGHRAMTRVELGCGVDRKTGLVQPPKIEATSPLKRPKYAAGRRGLTPSSGETDVIYLTQVDPTLVERGLVPLADLAGDQEAFVEIEHVGARGGVGGERPVRRYRLAEAPQFDALRMQWVLALAPVEPSKPFGGPRLG